MTEVEREPPGRDYGADHPLRPDTLAGLLSLVLFALCSWIVYRAVRDAAPPAMVIGLQTYVLTLCTGWLACCVIMLTRRPGAQELSRIWGRAAQVVIYGCHLACLWLIWLLLPWASPQNQLLIVVFMVAYVPVQLLASPENALANRIGIVAVLGSTAFFLVTRESEMLRWLGVYVTGFGLLLYAISAAVRHTVERTVRARLASERNAAELERLIAVLGAERDAKTRFIASVSHDLSQPLQAAALFFDQSVRAKDADGRARAIDGARRAFASADQLLAHLLNHLRLNADAVQPQPSAQQAKALLQRVASQFRPAAAAAGIELRTQGADATLMLDPSLIDRALGNLVQNAIRHSAGRRILLAARRQAGGRLRLWVIDDGAGVQRSEAPHIFDDYYQVIGATAPAPGGFGLGLSSARRLANLMGGEAGLDLRWRRGAAFYLEFPCRETSAAAVSPRPGARAFA